MNSVLLTDEQLLHLDGVCDDDVQQKVDAARNRIEAAKGKDNAELWHLIADMKTHAEANMKLDCTYKRGRKCRICGTGGGYWPYTRSSRCHRRGDPNFDRPKLIEGVDFDTSFVTIKDSIRLGCCRECFEKHRETIVDALKDVRAELPERLTGKLPRYRQYKNRKCTKCGWEGHEGEMGRVLALIGSGTVPAKCPKCKVVKGIFGREIDIADGYTLVDMEPTDA